MVCVELGMLYMVHGDEQVGVSGVLFPSLSLFPVSSCSVPLKKRLVQMMFFHGWQMKWHSFLLVDMVMSLVGEQVFLVHLNG